MKLHLTYLGALLALLTAALTGCQPDQSKTPAQERDCSFTIETPVGLKDASYSALKVTITSDKEDKAIELKPEKPTFTHKLLEGTYTLSLTADLSYKSDKFGSVDTQIATEQSIKVAKGQTTFTITPQYAEGVASGFVIEEIFFSPTMDPKAGKKGKSIPTEQYIKITNNSDVTLHADGLGIAQSNNLTNVKRDYVSKEALKDILPVSFLYVIPGNGKEHPVKPGASLIIANDAQDHSKVLEGAVDLSGADFEMYDLSSSPKLQDTDNLQVPNLLSYYKSSKTISLINQQGNSAIALARVPVDAETFQKDYAWEETYIFRFKEIVKEMPDKAYKIPLDWIQDVVILGIKDKVDWRFVPETLDAGYTGCLDSMGDKTAHGTAVIRKVDREANGRKYLKDTNNSSEDFSRRVTPSLKK